MAVGCTRWMLSGRILIEGRDGAQRQARFDAATTKRSTSVYVCTYAVDVVVVVGMVPAAFPCVPARVLLSQVKSSALNP